MGCTFRYKIKRDKGAAVEAARQDLYNWVESKGGYDKFYYPWRLANHLCVVYPENYKGRKHKASAEYIGIGMCGVGECLVFHHDIPWFSHLPPEVLSIARECFERHGVVDVWWAIIGEEGQGQDFVEAMYPELEWARP